MSESESEMRVRVRRSEKVTERKGEKQRDKTTKERRRYHVVWIVLEYAISVTHFVNPLILNESHHIVSNRIIPTSTHGPFAALRST